MACLDFQRWKPKAPGLQRRPISLTALIQEIADEWRKEMEDKGLTLQVELSPGPCRVDADVRRLRWAIINWCACLAIYAGGGQVKLKVSMRQGQVILDIADTGVGIPAHKQQKLFTRFTV